MIKGALDCELGWDYRPNQLVKIDNVRMFLFIRVHVHLIVFKINSGLKCMSKNYSVQPFSFLQINKI